MVVCDREPWYTDSRLKVSFSKADQCDCLWLILLLTPQLSPHRPATWMT